LDRFATIVADLIVDGVSVGQHALMQNTRDKYPARRSAIKHDVPAMLHSPQPRANVLAASAQLGVFSQGLATILKLAEVEARLDSAPRAKRVNADVEQIGLSTARKEQHRHG
jgi:hypothetical protein